MNPADRLAKLRRLLTDAIPFPARGRGFFVDTALPFLLREGIAALGADRVRAVERDLVAARALEAACPEVAVAHSARPEPSQGDLVVMALDKSRQRLHAELARLAGAVGPTGRLAVYGARKEGIAPAADFLAEFCQLDPPVTRAGLRLILAQPRDAAPAPPPAGSYEAAARNASARVAIVPGVFSAEGLDPATALMLEHCGPRPEDRLLDFGCGAGAVAALLLAGGAVADATLTDSDALALEAARATLALNGLDAPVLASDAGDALSEKSFDLILCNPPFHRGFATERDTVERMIERGGQLLAARGRFYLVGPPSLALRGRLEPRFKRVEYVAGDASIELWRAARLQRVRD